MKLYVCTKALLLLWFFALCCKKQSAMDGSWIYSDRMIYSNHPSILTSGHCLQLIRDQVAGTSISPLLHSEVEKKRLYFELPTLVFKVESSHPLEKGYVGCFCPGSCSFSHEPCHITIDENQNVDRPVNEKFGFLIQLFFHEKRLEKCPQFCKWNLNLSIHLPYPPTITYEQNT